MPFLLGLMGWGLQLLWDSSTCCGCEEGISVERLRCTTVDTSGEWKGVSPPVLKEQTKPPFILGVFCLSLGRLARKILVICQTGVYKEESHHCYCCLEGPWSKPEPCKLPPWFRKGLTTYYTAPGASFMN